MIVTPSDYKLLNESGKFYLEGKGTEANVKNGNGRIYPDNILKPAFFTLKDVLDENKYKIYSNMEHPKNPQPVKTRDSIGHLVDMSWDNDQNVGYVKIFIDQSLPKGEELIRRYNAGEQIGVSHRARGLLDESETFVTAMTLYSFDATVIPSCKTCILNLSESKEQMKVAEIEHYFEVINESAYDASKDKVIKSLKQDHLIKLFESMLRNK